MPTKLIVHLVSLLGIFILLNAGVKWLLIPELITNQTEMQKKYQEDLGLVLLDMPLLGEYINSLHQSIEKNVKSKIDKKSQVYAIEQQFKDQFIYFFQKQILLHAQVLIKKEPDTSGKSTNIILPHNELKFSEVELDNSKSIKIDPTPSYFKDLAAQLNATQIENITSTFQEHIKKLKPVFNKLDITVIQYDKVIPEAILENNNFLTDFHYQLNENIEIHLAFLNAVSTSDTQLPNLGEIRGIKSFYQADTTNQKATSLLTQNQLPLIDWKTIKSQFPSDKGQRRYIISDSTEVLQMWRWKQPGNIIVLELFWPVSKNYFTASILYDYVLLFFILLMSVWFYFYQDSQSKEKNNILRPNEISNLKKENKQLEKLLIDTMENQHKKNQPEIKTEKLIPENIFKDENKKSYLLPNEQSYIDAKIDLQKDSRDILMEESRTDLLKSLIKKIREG